MRATLTMLVKAAFVLTLAVTLVAPPVGVAAQSTNGNGDGNPFGAGFGKGKLNNPVSVKGAPLPLAGVTVLGQIVTLVGGVLIWRRCRKQGKSHARQRGGLRAG